MDKKLKGTDKIVCVACLRSKQTVKKITEHNLLQCYNSILEEIPVSTTTSEPTMCSICTDLLKKFSAFKEKVKESYKNLYSYSSEDQKYSPVIQTDNKFYGILAKPEAIDIPEPINIPEAIDIPSDVDMFVKEEVKAEAEFEHDGLDTEIDALGDSLDNNSDISAENDNDTNDYLIEKKIETKKSRKNLNSSVKKENKIVKVIQLSFEEMLQERKKDAARECYRSAKYRCTSCYLVFAYQRSFDVHMKAKHDPDAVRECYRSAKYRCTSCYLVFAHQRSLDVHMKAKHDPSKGDYSCPVCSVVIPSVEAFTAHYKRHMRRYECSVCQKRSPDMKAIQRHYYTVHETSTKDYKCNLCAKVFKSMDAHRYHKDTQHKGRVQCDLCDKTFTHRNGLQNHRRAAHGAARKIICAQCGKEFRWKTSLKRHEDRHHNTKQSSSALSCCQACDITFASVSSYMRHMKNSLKHVSKDQLRYICDECGKRFSNKTKLRDHIEEKHLHRKFSCHICNKPSKNRVALDQHIRNVHKGRPNNKMCHQCGKGFPTKMQLESHMRTHTGERPFICEYCPTTFSQQSNLYKHNRQVHMSMKKQPKKADESRTQDSKPGASTSVLEATVLLNHPAFAM